MDFGKKIHKMIEDGELDYLFIDAEHRFTAHEKELTPTLGEIPLKGYIDALNTDERVIGDYKVSKNERTQSQVDRNDQLTFYSLLCKEKYGWIPEARIYRIEAQDLKLTGRVDVFKTKRTERDLEIMKEKIKKVWKEIPILMDAELKAKHKFGSITNKIKL